jgi:hypothetical protein
LGIHIGDPLAQSFFVTEKSGVFLTSVDIFFEIKDEDNIPITLQIRPLIAGVPSNLIIPFSEVTLTPDQINLSVDGRVATRFTFPSPVYLRGPQEQSIRHAPVANQTVAEYAIVLVSNSPNYRVFVTEMPQNDILTGVRVSRQPTLGSMFKSQNGTTWTPSQLEDLKYRIYRADFENEGILRLYNPKLGLGNKKVTVTGPNQFEFLSKRIFIGLSSAGYSPIVAPGMKIIQNQTSASGTLIGIAGSIVSGTGTTISSVGIGYTNGTFNDVELLSESGFGVGAIANIGIVSSGITTVTITNGGFGYQIGDSLGVPSLGQGVGFGGKLTVTNINPPNTFVLDQVQGNFIAGISTISYVNSSGIITSIANGITIDSILEDQYYDGLHVKVYHPNHGMHSYENYVKISEFRPLNNDLNTTTSTVITSTENTSISIVSSTGFELFEGREVNILNPGYIIIGNEIIAYTGITANSLTGITRQIDGTQSIAYPAGTFVYKYEFNGVSLRRINGIHNFTEVNNIGINKYPINLNSYFIKINMGDVDFNNQPIGINRVNDLYFRQNIQSGPTGTVITNNIQYESINPKIATIIPTKTNIITKIRTFTGTSISGNEKSFVDSGYEIITLNDFHYFTEPKLICSTVNEDRFITESPGNRSLSMELLFTTEDKLISPVVDSVNMSVILTTNLVNSPNGIGEFATYASDNKIRSIDKDDHEAIYISKINRLKIPANSLKVLLSASRNNLNDIRVL